MKVTFSKGSLGIILGLSLASGAALADPVVGAGSFYAGGTVNVSATTIDFGTSSLPPPGNQEATITLPTTGAFSYLTYNTVIGMQNLNLASATVTATDINFDGAVPDFVTLPADSTGTGIDLSLTDIPINTSVPLCSSFTSAQLSNLSSGIECRAYASSPILLQQNTQGVNAALNLLGDAYYVGTTPSSGTPYTGELTATFTGDTLAGLLSTFATTGSVTPGLTAQFATTPLTATPEPGTVTALGVGLLLIGLINKKKRSTK